MILKSLSRKEPTFGQLLMYIQKEASQDYGLFHNFDYGRGFDNETILEQFLENNSLLEQSRGSNALFHEIVSLKRTHEIPLETFQKALYDIVQEYVEVRGENLLCYGNMHHDKESVHFHLLMSSNELGSEKRYRLEKAQFQEIQKSIESKVLERYPELQQEVVYNKEQTKEKVQDKEYNLKRRTGRQTKREQVKEILETIYTHSKTKEEFNQALKHYKIETYQRGKFDGIIFEGKKYRLHKLELVEQYQNLLQSFERQEELQQTREQAGEARPEPEQTQEADTELDRRLEELRKARQKEQSLELDNEPENERLRELREIRTQQQEREQEHDLGLDFER